MVFSLLIIIYGLYLIIFKGIISGFIFSWCAFGSFIILFGSAFLALAIDKNEVPICYKKREIHYSDNYEGAEDPEYCNWY